MDFQSFMQWVFYGVIGGSAVYAVSILKSLDASIDRLNVRFAKLVEKTVWHERSIGDTRTEIKEHDERIRALEKRSQ